MPFSIQGPHAKTFGEVLDLMDQGDLSGFKKCLAKLEEQKADIAGTVVFKYNEVRYTLASYAARKGLSLEFLKALVEVDPKVLDDRGVGVISALESSIREKSMGALEYLLDGVGMDPVPAFAIGSTPLIVAAHQGYPPMTEFILKKLLNAEKHNAIDMRNGYGQTALMIAAQVDFHSVKLLVEAGADMDLVDNSGETALGVVCARMSRSSSSIFQDSLRESAMFLAERATAKNINHQDNYRGTAAHFAASIGDLEVLKLLKQKGANFDLVSKDHGSVYSTAAIFGQVKVLEYFTEGQNHLLTDSNEGHSDIFMRAAQHGRVEILRMVTRRGVDWNSPDAAGYDAIYMATREGQTAVIDLAVEEGRDWNAPDSHGLTATMYAAQHNQAGFLRHVKERYDLVDCWQEVGQDDVAGYSHLMIAAHNEAKDVVKFLIENDIAHPEIINAEGKDIFGMVVVSDEMKDFIRERMSAHEQRVAGPSSVFKFEKSEEVKQLEDAIEQDVKAQELLKSFDPLQRLRDQSSQVSTRSNNLRGMSGGLVSSSGDVAAISAPGVSEDHSNIGVAMVGGGILTGVIAAAGVKKLMKQESGKHKKDDNRGGNGGSSLTV